MESEGGKKEGRRRIPNAGEVMKERGSEGGGVETEGKKGQGIFSLCNSFCS